MYRKIHYFNNHAPFKIHILQQPRFLFQASFYTGVQWMDGHCRINTNTLPDAAGFQASPTRFDNSWPCLPYRGIIEVSLCETLKDMLDWPRQ